MADRLTLYKPISPFNLSQTFGEDLTCVDPSTKRCVTRLVGMSCPPGHASLYKSEGLEGHNGLDIRAKHGQPIYAATEGIVDEIETEEKRGLGLGIVSENKYQFDNVSEPHYVKTRYWHLLSFNVKKGEKVRVGQLIGWADNTGASSGDHLHFELKMVEKKKPGVNARVVNKDNGFFGAIDPAPYLTNLDAFDKNSLLRRTQYKLADMLNRSKLTG